MCVCVCVCVHVCVGNVGMEIIYRDQSILYIPLTTSKESSKQTYGASILSLHNNLSSVYKTNAPCNN